MSQEKYMTKVLQRFGMESAKSVGSTFLTNSKLSSTNCPKTKTKKVEMMKVPYASPNVFVVSIPNHRVLVAS